MNLRLRLYKSVLIIISGFIFLCKAQSLNAQCGAPVSVFPYSEGFEINDGGWASGGSLSDWAWGAPAKTVISSAATGTKCWNVGGLVGGRYNDGEASWLQSPCFDFTGLQYPFISFNVFWEMERRFDGAGFQYSTDLGVSWTNVGSVSDAVNCLNENWFNFSPIQYINTLATVRDGWSGNIQTTVGSCQGSGGSAGWVTAKHTMPYLAGRSNVIFRFIFGAGTVCNNYDGFAVDDILIAEAPPNNASFTYSCTNSNTVSFTNTSDLCPASNWDFGDIASGPNNTSTAANPTHIFSAPGTYTVTLIASGPDNAASTTTETIHILGLTTTVISNNNCSGDNNGSASVSVQPAGVGPFSYSWNTSPVQTTAAIAGLPGGMYTVTVNAANSCNASATINITEPAAMSHIINIVQPGCAVATGTATIVESGGTGPYTYAWSPSGGNAATATGLTPGNYSVTITDSRGCIDMANLTIATAIAPAISIVGKKDASCFGLHDGAATALASGGNSPYTYSWNTIPVQNTASASNLSAGNFSVTVTDNNGCKATTSVQINEPASGSCSDVYFPNAFTPNGDAINPNFGAVGNLMAISEYSLHIYNRYGELVFYTRDPYKKWDGLYKGKQLSGTYAWVAGFIFKGQFTRDEKGTVTIIR